MRGDIITPAITLLVGVASGIYIFQPVILEQLKKDGNLDPKYNEDEKLVEKRLGDFTGQRNPVVPPEVYPENQKSSGSK